MYDTLLINFIIILSSFYLYVKMLNDRNTSSIKIITYIILSMIFSYTMFILRIYIPNARNLFIIILSSICMSIITKTPIDVSLISMLLSFGISHALFFLSSSVIVVLTFALSIHNYIIIILLSYFPQLLLIRILFMIKRFKNGFPFLRKKRFIQFGMLTSIFILIFTTLIGKPRSAISDVEIILFSSGTLIAFISLIFWWRLSTTKLYKNNLVIKERERLLKTVKENEKYIMKLTLHNYSLSKQIHKDNKLFPAMAMSVRQFMYDAIQKGDIKTQLEGKRILAQLEQILQERSHSIASELRKNKTLPTTKVAILDSILEYMRHKASEKEIDLDLILSGSVTYMIENIIPVIQLETLIADLIENAIIALNTSLNMHKKILVTIGIINGAYELSVSDSGIPFEIETLLTLGKHQVTTHADDGGSGIGFMTTFEIMQQTNASLIITENGPNLLSYGKSIKMRFDGRSSYMIQSFRANEIRRICERTDIIISEN